MVYYLITKHSTDDYSLWITEDIDDVASGSSIRGSLNDVKAEIDTLLTN